MMHDTPEYVTNASDKCMPAQVIMYDEPTAGLDPVASTVVEDLMRSMHDSPDPSMNGSSRRSGITSYIVVTHQHSTIRRAVDRLIFLHEVSYKIESCNLSAPSTCACICAIPSSPRGDPADAIANRDVSVLPGMPFTAHWGSVVRRPCVVRGERLLMFSLVPPVQKFGYGQDRVPLHAQGAVVWEGSVEEFDTCDVPIVRQFASGSLNGPIQYE